MMDALWIALYLQIPVVIGGVLHMLVVTHDGFNRLKRPINQTLFGANKTWRGILLVPLLTAFGALFLLPVEWLMNEHAILGSSLWLVGWIVGLGYVLAELPNSYIKRRLGIAAGETPQKHRTLFIFMDQFDSALGVAIAYALYPGFDIIVCFWYAVTFPITALLVKRALFVMKLKKTAV